MKKIAVFVKGHEGPLQKANELAAWLEKRGVRAVLEKSRPPVPDVRQETPVQAPPDLDCVIVLGGDGTFLASARWVGSRDIPILGVKFGDVGFLSEAMEDDLFPVVESILEGRYATQERSRLLARVLCGSELVTEQLVLNDIVINNGTLARLAHIHTSVDGEYLTTYRADGLIVATPTGSTAYSLAAGGPVVHPAASAIILTPICPFALANRPLVVPDGCRIQLHLEKPSPEVRLTFDGQAGLDINQKHVITVSLSTNPVRMIKVPGQTYFDVLKSKLRWSGGKP